MDVEVKVGQTWRAKASGLVVAVVAIDDDMVELNHDGHTRWCSAEGLLNHWEPCDAGQ
jgi:hypothetical protein